MRKGRGRSFARRLYGAFILLIILVLALSAIPVVASDLFREPYAPAWTMINRLMARFHYTYNPTGGGVAPRFPSWRDPADAWLYYRDVTLTTADGLHLAAWYVPATKPNAPSMLLCHGLYDSKWTMLRLVPWLHKAGYNVLLFDFRGHGGSDKQPTTIGRLETLDVQAALNWLDEAGAGDRVGGLGMSLGAAALVSSAAQDDRLDALILDSLFADWTDVDYAEGYRLPPDWLVPDVPSPVELLPRIHVPVFIIHGTADILTHVDHARRLYAAANEPKELWINDSGHAWSAWTYPRLYQDLVLDFLDITLHEHTP
jgi:alpha-beta hydrolase superfamily lysophospholipase